MAVYPDHFKVGGPKPKSERHQLADRLAKIICDTKMTNPFGGNVNQSNRCYNILFSRPNRCYNILFSRPRVLDGLVKVFSPKFILIECQGPAVSGNWSAVYESEANAAAFLKALAKSDETAAMLVPYRSHKR